jgi:hypothetical protein
MIQQLSEDLSWGQLVARAWCDDGLMKRLLSDPREVLAEHGLEVSPDTDVEVALGTEVKVVNDADARRRFIMTSAPPDELMDEELVASPMAGCFSAACVACGACRRCACRCAACRCAVCRCF